MKETLKRVDEMSALEKPPQETYPASASRRSAPQGTMGVDGSRFAEIRFAELEMENLRLHRLVAELMIKNQQLRRTP
jgi:hypothetical protein